MASGFRKHSQLFIGGELEQGDCLNPDKNSSDAFESNDTVAGNSPHFSMDESDSDAVGPRWADFEFEDEDDSEIGQSMRVEQKSFQLGSKELAVSSETQGRVCEAILSPCANHAVEEVDHSHGWEPVWWLHSQGYLMPVQGYASPQPVQGNSHWVPGWCHASSDGVFHQPLGNGTCFEDWGMPASMPFAIPTPQHDVGAQWQFQPRPGELDSILSRMRTAVVAAESGDIVARKGVDKTEKILTKVREELADALANQPFGWLVLALQGNIWFLSKHADGCWLLQAAAEELVYLGEEELRGHVIEAIKHDNANHVLQRFIMAAPPEKSQFIIDEIMKMPQGALWCAKHSRGCRVLLRLLETCSHAQLADMKVTLLGDAANLKKNKYSQLVLRFLKRGS